MVSGIRSINCLVGRKRLGHHLKSTLTATETSRWKRLHCRQTTSSHKSLFLQLQLYRSSSLGHVGHFFSNQFAASLQRDIYNYGSTQLRVSALTSVIKPELNQKSDIITAPNMSSVCNTSRPQLCVVDSMVMNNGMQAVLSPTEYSTAEQIQMWLTSFLGWSGQMYYVNAPSRAQLGNFRWCHWPQCLHVVTCVKV